MLKCIHLILVNRLIILRDCAIDGTCVLCMTCFMNGIHKDHNYQVMQMILA